jgi:hypothetical protein
MDDSTRRTAEQEGIDEQELMRRYLQCVTDWSERGAVKIYRNGKLLGPPIVPRKWKPMFHGLGRNPEGQNDTVG